MFKQLKHLHIDWRNSSLIFHLHKNQNVIIDINGEIEIEYRNISGKTLLKSQFVFFN